MAGQPYDQGSRLYYMRARYYDPQLGRFLSEDPIGVSGGLNLYAYAGNDPVNMWDPTGMDPMAGGEGCDLPGGGRGVRNKQGECVAVTLPDITVSSQAEPPTDIVTIEPGRQYFINVYEGAVYPAKTGRKPWQEPQSLGPPVLARHGTPDSVVTACVMLRKQVKKGVGRAIVGLPLLPMEMAFGSGFGRLPHHVGSVNDVIPGGVWTHLQEGTAEALPPFAEYQALDCQHNVLQSD
jgi:RHS repeat-associated protein